jgi:UDP-N-acetylglucosamine 1-carboxyvinyltransferase
LLGREVAVSTIVVKGGGSLQGSIHIEGSKNAVLPILAATLLGNSASTIGNVPHLEDVRTILQLLDDLGATVTWLDRSTVRIDPRGVSAHQPSQDLVGRMRASLLVLGPLLARLGLARSHLPGGCAIGTRPIDLHLKGFEALGASVAISGGTMEVSCPRLKGAHIYLDYPSVTATENILMAASTAQGITLLENAAEEPEVVDLARFLNAMGASVTGTGTGTITIEGVQELAGVSHTVIPDRIECGTYMVATAISRGSVRLEGAMAQHLQSVLAKLQEAGVSVVEGPGWLQVTSFRRPRAVDIKTLPYPGFPTDMQAPFMSLLTLAQGVSVISETVFENRFLHVDELKRMGAKIKIESRAAVIQGVRSLSGAPVKATDLRAGAALVLAGLAAEGVTVVSSAEHIQRGYVDMPGKLRALGADVQTYP